MTKINKSNIKGLTKEKKALFKSLVGSASSSKIDLNKVRDEWKYGEIDKITIKVQVLKTVNGMIILKDIK